MTIDERMEILAAAERSPEFQQELRFALLDPDIGDALFINAFCTTYDPRNDPATGKPIGYVPFLMWKEQEDAAREFGRAMDLGYDIGGEKSRDMGMTWIVLACIVKRWLLHDGFSALVGSITQELLDNDKSPSSLFWKIKILVQYTLAVAPWLTPAKFDWDAHHTWAKLENPQTGGTIQGRAPTVRFPIGDRQTVIYFDDFAQWEVGGEAWENAAATTNCRCATWTANGLNFAWELRFGKGKFEGVKIKIVNIHWKSDPRKQATAIDETTGKVYNIWQREMVGDAAQGIPGKISYEQFLKDYEFQYETSQKGRIYGSQMPHVSRGKFPYNPAFPTWTFWDYGTTDACVILFVQLDVKRFRFRIVDRVIGNGQGIEFYIPMVNGRQDEEILKHEKDYTLEDLQSIERRTSWQVYDRVKDKKIVPYYGHFGDPAGKAKSISHNKSAKEMLWEADIEVEDKDTNEAKSYMGRIEAARFMLRYTDINDELCEDVAIHLSQYKWAKSGLRPEHDDASHTAAAWEYGCQNLIDWFQNLLKERQMEKKAVAPEQNYAIFGVSKEEADQIRRMDSRRYEQSSGGVYYPAPTDSAAGY